MQQYETKNLLQDWTIEPSSTRTATLDYIASAPGKNALQINLGGGRGDTINLGHPIVRPAVDGKITLKVMARAYDKEPVKIGLVLSKTTERPWIALKKEQLTLGRWHQFKFELSGINQEKLDKTDRLIISIETDGDEGFVLIDQVEVKY